jgi:hypothetical protein
MGYDVQINIAPRDQVKSIIHTWENEDSYYSSMNTSVAGIFNKKARKYPYLESYETKPDSYIFHSDVPVSGPVNIVYLDGRSDSGLPHTRGKYGIALPVFLLWHPSEKTLRHELVHISQKQYPSRWWEWYEREWGFRLARPDEFMSIPEKWRLRRRINPDTMGSHYSIWQGRYIPLSVFINETDPDLRFCKRGFWDVKMSQWTWDPPSGWITLFGEGFNDEHPHEIIAHWIDGSAGEKRKEYFHINPV